MAIMHLYLGDEMWVNMTGLVYHSLKDVSGFQIQFLGFMLLLYKVQQRVHFFTSKIQHWVQVINHTVFKHKKIQDLKTTYIENKNFHCK